MLFEVEGDVFNSPLQVMAHGVNCRGTMGKGIALSVKLCYPAAFKAYRAKYAKEGWHPGDVQIVKLGERWVANCATQEGYAPYYGATPEAIETALGKLIELLKKEGLKSFAMPRIGCSLGGLTWGEVRPIIEKLATDFDIYVYSSMHPAWGAECIEGGPASLCGPKG